MQGLTTVLDENLDYLLQQLEEKENFLEGRTSLSLEVRKICSLH